MWGCLDLTLNGDKEKMGRSVIRERKMCSLGQFSLFFLPDVAKQLWEYEALNLLLKNKTKKALDYLVNHGL